MRPGGLGRIPNPDTSLATLIYPVTEKAGYKTSLRTYRYWWEGGAWLDQGQFGTCVGNAFAHRIADNPVPEVGIDETYARQLYLDASGDTTYQRGTSGLAACRVLKTRGTISQYHWVSSPDELVNTVLELGSVCFGVNWLYSMFSPKLEYGNSYIKVTESSGLAGGHELLLNGINLHPAAGPPFYRLKNSWGTTWGHGGTARIACADLDSLIFEQNGDAVLVTEVAP
jgi:hypothetical protein